MPSRFAPVLTATIALLVVAGCAGTAAIDPVPTAAAPVTTPRPQPKPTPVPTPLAVPTPTPSENAGNIDGFGSGPELSIEFLREDVLEVVLEDREARAWRLVIEGRGALSQDRWEILVETGDLGPAITATEIQEGDVVAVMDLASHLEGTAAAGGCHGTLGACLDSSAIALPADGDGRLAIRLRMPGQDVPLTLTGGSAGWPGEPFVLGPWSDTEPFPWGEG